MKAPQAVKNFKLARKDYTFNSDVFDEDTPRVRTLKRIIGELPIVEQTIIILYVETQSTREVAKILRVSQRTAAREVAHVKQIIINKYNEHDLR